MYLASQYGRPQPRGSYLAGAASSKARRASRSLSALTPDQAAEQIFPSAKVRSGAGHNASVRNLLVSSAQAGQMLDVAGAAAYVSAAECAGVSLLKPALTGTIGSLALKFTPQAFAAGPVVGAVVLAVAGIAELFTVIFGHHAAAIKKERATLCAAVPAANQSLQLIDQAVQQGQATPQDAIVALGNVASGFAQQVRSIIKGADPTSSGECNAACVMLSELRAIVALKQSVYQDMINAGGSGSVSSAVASLGIPPWALYAAGGLLLWKVL